MPALLKEPLVQFLLTGAIIFVCYQWLNPLTKQPAQEIHISAQRLEQLAASFKRTWKRPPSHRELETLVNDYVLEEVYYREARLLGLDQDDLIIRRRLQQKMIFLTESLASQSPATDEELLQYLSQHSEMFLQPAQFTFNQVVFKGEQGYQRSQEALIQGQYEGDASMLPGHFGLTSSTRIAHQFGERFSQSLAQSPLNQWHGPIQSTYGWHLIYVHQMAPSKLPLLAEIRSEVERQWLLKAKQLHRQKLDNQLTSQYQVRVDWDAMPESMESSSQAQPEERLQ